MDKFAFVIHPIYTADLARKIPLAKYLPEYAVEKVARLLPPMKVSAITGIRSSFNECSGEFIACPLTSRQLLNMPVQEALAKIVSSVRLAEQRGARIVGLGALTSVVGDAGLTVAQKVGIAVTTGNSYTVYTALEGAKEAARLMGITWATANILIVGATGSVGSVCTRMLARESRNLTVLARNQHKLESLAASILYETGVAVRITGDIKGALQKADVIIAVTASLDTPILPEYLKSGVVVCDVARPRDVSVRVARERDDVLVIEGGVVDVPGEPDFHFNFGFPPGKAYACMAETMILALEKRYECYSLGRNITVEQVENIGKLAAKHGFKLSGFRSFEKALTHEDIKRIKANAQRIHSTSLIKAGSL